MRDFQTEGALWEAEAARGAHEDCIIAAGIAHYVCWRLQGGETEPLADRRRRRKEEALRRARQGNVAPPDYRNSDTTAQAQHEQQGHRLEERLDGDTDDPGWFYDPDSRGQGGTLY
jgi:hypothetical protein